MSHVHAIFIAPAAKAPMQAVEAIDAVVGKGLVGDRYYLGIGAFSRWPGEGRQITLIEAETLDDIYAEAGIDLSAGQHRRNVVTVGVRLNELVEKRFQIGSLLLRGQRLCAPCRYLDGILGESVFDAMKNRGGLRAEVLEGGTLRVGDSIAPAFIPSSGTPGKG